MFNTVIKIGVWPTESDERIPSAEQLLFRHLLPGSIGCTSFVVVPIYHTGSHTHSKINWKCEIWINWLRLSGGGFVLTERIEQITSTESTEEQRWSQHWQRNSNIAQIALANSHCSRTKNEILGNAHVGWRNQAHSCRTQGIRTHSHHSFRINGAPSEWTLRLGAEDSSSRMCIVWPALSWVSDEHGDVVLLERLDSNHRHSSEWIGQLQTATKGGNKQHKRLQCKQSTP